MTPNVFLVILDAVRARSTSLHGYERETTPFLDSFADQVTWYSQARAPGTMSAQSQTSIFTGSHVAEHGLKDVGTRLEPGNTVWEELAADGYDTGVFSYNSYLTQAPIGLADAFDTVEDGRDSRLPFPEAFDPADLGGAGRGRYRAFLSEALSSGKPFRSMANGLALWEVTRSLFSTTVQGFDVVPDRVFLERFLDWQADREGPWAACVNFMGAHSPYLPAPKHNRWGGEQELEIMRTVENHCWSFIAGRRPWSDRTALGDLYDGCIRQVDALVESLVGELEARGILEDTLVVITADHGEGFGEPGEVRDVRSVAHGKTGGLEEWILHVPLIVSYPGQTVPTRVDEVASLTRFRQVVRDVVAGSTEADGFVPDDGLALSSSFAFDEGDRARLPDYVGDVSGYERTGRVVYKTTADGRVHKHVEHNGDHLRFDVTDPYRAEGLQVDDPDFVDRVFDALEPAGITRGAETAVSEAVQARLEELGYR